MVAARIQRYTIVEKFIADHPDLGLQLLHSNVGRARQMNAGAAVAKSPILLFLHADSRLPTHTVPAICATLNRHNWGFFRIRIDSPQLLLRVASQMMCWRSALTSIATGDQALFIKTALFQRLGGFATIPLMEDIELCHRLKGTGRPACVLRPVQTSARRWQSHGMVRTILLMWSLRFAYWRGVDPATLSRRYHHAR